jgi:hypothetical protein
VSDEETARELVRRWWTAVWRDGDINAVDQLVTDPFIRHTSAGTSRSSLKDYKKALVEFQRVLHDARTVIDDEAVAGDRIWVRATSRGANLETGGPALVTWMVCFRVEGGKLAETWVAVLPGVDWEKR